MPVLVTAEDLATHLGQDVNREQADQILDMVEALVLSVYGSEILPDSARRRGLLRQAVLTAAARTYTNPEGLASETVGDYTYRRDGAAMTLVDSERALIRMAQVGGAAGGLLSVPLVTIADRLA